MSLAFAHRWPAPVLVIGGEAFKLCPHCFFIAPQDLARALSLMPIIPGDEKGDGKFSEYALPFAGEGHHRECPEAKSGLTYYANVQEPDGTVHRVRCEPKPLPTGLKWQPTHADAVDIAPEDTP